MNGAAHTCNLASGVAPATCIACASMPFEEWLAMRGIKVDDAAWKDRDDKPLPEDAAIDAAFPTRSGRHDLYQEAMRLVGARFSKAGLVALVHWLLFRVDEANSRWEHFKKENATLDAEMTALEKELAQLRDAKNHQSTPVLYPLDSAELDAEEEGDHLP